MGYIKINKSHFAHNIDTIATQVGDIKKVAIVLKDNAYGHGLLPMAHLSQEIGIQHAVVRTYEEAIQIANHFETILVLATSVPLTTNSSIYMAINTLDTLKALTPGSLIELKMDTGMHRNGLTIDDLPQALEIIVSNNLQLKGVFSHHRSSDELSSDFFWQAKQFDTIMKHVKDFCSLHTLPIPRFHTENSAACFRQSHHLDMVRVGIAAYGLLTMPAVFNPPMLKPVLSLWAKKIGSFTLHTGEKVGYSGSYTVKETTLASTYDIGYGDGLLRLHDDVSYTTPNGSTLLGRVSMDNTIFTSHDDTLAIFEDARKYAQKVNTIVYEVLVRLHPDLPRILKN